MGARTTQDVLREWRNDLGSIPNVSNSFVCRGCLGPVNNFVRCSGCHTLFGAAGAPPSLNSRVIPMTSALNPSKWYTALVNYKTLQRELGEVLVSIAYHFLDSRGSQISALLIGAPTVITVVPSKRGVLYEHQPLARALSRVDSLKSMLCQTLEHDSKQMVRHRTYNAAAFVRGPTDVQGERVALIEDSWVSGATATSAAGALLGFGAASVVILPIARVIDPGFWPETHPYRDAMKAPFEPYDSSAWPR